MDTTVRALSGAGRLHPASRPLRHGVERIRDVPYGPLPANRLDVYRPLDPPPPGGRPVVLYLHGGGFQILSKDTHWTVGLAFARRGYVVFNADYRLAPAHPFPAAIEDAAAAYAWTVENAARWGGDPGRLVISGESAGGNLTAGILVASTWERSEPWARTIWDTGVVPRVALPACGLLQVSDTARFRRRKALSTFVADRIAEAEHAYLEGTDAGVDRGLADPLLRLEEADGPDRPLPPVFGSVGTWDPILDDTRRLGSALERLGAECEVRYYERELHGFQVVVVTPGARAYWNHAYRFLDRFV